MTVNEFELLMEMKARSNFKFHSKGGVQNLQEAIKRFLSDDLQVYKEPLRKLLDAHEIWNLSDYATIANLKLLLEL
jgi:hypothetical protein